MTPVIGCWRGIEGAGPRHGTAPAGVRTSAPASLGLVLLALVAGVPTPLSGQTMASAPEVGSGVPAAHSLSPVADAAMEGRRDAVLALLREGADVNVPQGDGMTGLHWAAERGDEELTRVLLDAGADVSPRTRLGSYTPLHLAARTGAGPVVRLLLTGGAEPDAPSQNGTTPLHFAAGAGEIGSVASLLEYGALVDATESAWEQTPLMFAASYGRAGVIRLLLEAGADASRTSRVVDLPTVSAGDAAARQRRNEVLAELRSIEGAGDPAWRPSPAQVRMAVEAARDVQRAGGDGSGAEESTGAEGEVTGFPGMVGTQGGLTALLHAVREGHADAAFALLDGGADLNQISGGDGTSPLLMATLNGHLDLALVLLQRGADPNVASAAGAAPLYATVNVQWAPKSRYPQPRAHEQQRTTYLEFMEALLDAGADPNARLDRHLWYMSYTFDLLSVDTRGSTPFWRAAYAADVPAMRLLVAHGANPHIPTLKPAERRRRGGAPADGEADPSGLPPIPVDGPGVWPIHAASGVGYGEGYAANAHRHAPDGWLPAVRYLVEEVGADVNARDHNGYNAVHHAAARGDNELILYLVDRGADVTAVSRSGQTTADMANGPVQRISPFLDTLALLEGLGARNNNRCMSC